jgi:thermitase
MSRKLSRVLLLATFLTIGLTFSAFYKSQIMAQAVAAQGRVPGQVLVKFKDSTPNGVITAELRKHNGNVVGQINGIDTFVVHVPDGAVDNVVSALSRNPNVEFAEADYVSTVMDYPVTAPNDTNFADKQWGFENTGQTISTQIGTVDADIDAQTAWSRTTGSTPSGGIKLAVLDTGLDTAHPEFTGKVVLSKDFTGSGSTDDRYGHGTHVSGIAAAVTNNSTGVAGTCPDCTLVIGKVLNDSGSGANSWIASGITWAADNGAKVINMSLGGPTKSSALESAVNYAWRKGVVVVAAAGNSANPSKTYPGAYTNVIAVAATDNRDRKASFSSYGNWVDVAAPGVNIYSTFPTHPYKINKSLNYDYGSGTSMATPMVAGTAALIWASSHGTSASSVRSRLENTADKIPGTGSYWVKGRINAGTAMTP